jgi:predicted HicB family RNase H-like nuclease
MSEDRIPMFIRVPRELKSDVADAAWKHRVSVSKLVEESVRAHLARLDEDKIPDTTAG